LPAFVKAQRAVLLACAVAGASACADGPPSPPEPAHRATMQAPAAIVTTPGDPRTRVISAYDGMWHAFAAAARTADYQPEALSRYAAGDALAVLTHALYDNHQHGIVLRGAPSLSPRVIGMTPAANPDSSSVTDCADDSQWRQYTTAGKPAAGAPSGRHRIRARLQLFTTAWKVTYLVVEKAGSC
jgi:ketosteroid isomerase-like protein